VLDFRDRHDPGGGHHRVEVARGSTIDEIPGAVTFPGADEREVGADRRLEDVRLAVDDARLLALGDNRSIRGRREEAADARPAGAGIPAFYTPTGVGTDAERGKETKEIDGRRYVLERALHGDVALVRAHTSDRFGNLRFWRTGRNFNPVMATAARLSIVECDHLVDNGAIDPDDVHLSGIYAHRIVHVPEHENAFEYRTVRKRP